MFQPCRQFPCELTEENLEWQLLLHVNQSFARSFVLQQFHKMDEIKVLLYDPWLARILNKDAYRVLVNDELLACSGQGEAAEMIRCRPGFFYSKVPAGNTLAAHFLEALGFLLVDTNIVFEKPVSSSRGYTGNCKPRMARPEDCEPVKALARSSFTYTRFHLDPQVPKELADTIKAEWAGNYFSGARGHAMVVATIQDQLAGFNLLMSDPEGKLIIDLIAVDPACRRRGVARDMIAFAEEELGLPGGLIRVGTQVANIPSIRLYEGIGFRMCEATYVFHCHH